MGGGTVFVYSGSGVNSFMNSLPWHAAEKTESKPVYERVCDTVRGTQCSIQVAFFLFVCFCLPAHS